MRMLPVVVVVAILLFPSNFFSPALSPHLLLLLQILARTLSLSLTRDDGNDDVMEMMRE
jgi:hypothetical protein